MTYGTIGYTAHAFTAPSQSFKTLKIGAGGFMRMLDLHTDGTKLCSSDVYGCWMWNAGTGIWDSLLTPARGFGSVTGDSAAYDMQAAPSNSNVIYIYLNDGNLYRSLDHGASFVQLTNFTNAPCETNNLAVRFNGRRIAVDPINADVVYICTSGDNGFNVGPNVVRVTSNGTTTTPTFTNVASIGTSTAFVQGASAGYNVAFDPNGGSTSGKSNVVAVFSNGIGLYTTTAPLGTFTLQTTGSPPTTCSRMVCTQKAGTGSSIFYIANDTTTAYKFAAGTWSTLSPGLSCHSITVDPADNTRLLAASDGGTCAVSLNSGGAFTGLSTVGTNISPDIPWLAITQDTYKSNGDILFDPALTNSVMFAEGLGIYVKTAFPNSGSLQWTTQTQGIENIITNSIVASPNMTNKVMTSNWDRFGFYSSNQDAYPATQSPNNLYPIQACWDMDWATSDGKTLVGYAQDNINFTEASSMSSDDGQTWNFFPMQTNSIRTMTTSALSGIGSNTLTIASQPFTLALQMQVSDATNPAAIPTGTYITGISGSTIALSNTILSPGVGSGDTINFGFGGTSQYLKTTGSVTTGATVLTFTVSVPTTIKVGMLVNNVDNSQPTNLGGTDMTVMAVSGSTVTLCSPILGTIPSGSLIQFSQPSGGCVAASSPTNFIMAPFYYPLVTADAGATWTPIEIAGEPRPTKGTFTSGSTTVTGTDTTNIFAGCSISNTSNRVSFGGAGSTTVASITNSTTFELAVPAGASITDVINFGGWGHANYLNHKLVFADRVTPNKFYLYSYATGKLYVSTSSGANGTWTVANTVTTNLLTATGFNLNGGQDMQFKSVPLNAGHMFATNANVASGGNNNLVRSTDAGATWTSVSGVTGVNAFGFGMPKPGGGGYPAVFLWGKVSGVQSTWRSDDNCATWVNLGANPNGTLEQLKNFDGDKNTYGRFYFTQGANGNGYFG